ncbi:transposase [Candidatus Neomarinimicrobiota bacterium]
MAEKQSEAVVREIRRKTRRKYSVEEKIAIVLEGLRGEESVSGLCRREGISPNLYYRWSKDFLEAGKKRLMGDTLRETNSSEVSDLRRENEHLKVLVAELALGNRVLKKRLMVRAHGWTIYEAQPGGENGDHTVGRRIGSASETYA